MIKRTFVYYSPDGTSFDFNTYPSAVSDFDGIYQPSVIHSTQKSPYQDGETYLSSSMEPRDISLTVGYVGSFDLSSIKTYRRNLQAVCNVKTNDRLGVGKLVIIEDDVERIFYCVVDSLDMAPISKRKDANDCIVGFICHDPFCYSSGDYLQAISGYTKLALPTYLGLTKKTISDTSYTSEGTYTEV